MSKNKIGALIVVAATAYASLSHADSLGNYPESVATGPGKSREQVVQELQEFKRNPVLNGWKQLDGEQGAVYVGTSDSGVNRVQVQQELETFQHDRHVQARFSRLYGGA